MPPISPPIAPPIAPPTPPPTPTTTTTTLAESTDDVSLLNPGASPYCPAPCAKYHAGATSSMKYVCQYQASGTGTVAQLGAGGVACMPPYGCRPDWNVCILNNTDSLPAASPCSEIATLEAGGNSGDSPPSGGWQPTTTGGWMKMAGTPDCGWGSTYANVSPDTSYTLEEYGRVTIDGVTSNHECCVEAMKYEGVPLEQGGAAIRFGISGTACLIDREKMVQGNLDTSSGRSARSVQTCGPEGSYLFWREAAGSADASNLKTGGRCVVAGGFTKVKGSSATDPLGRLPETNSQELPNHPCSHEDAEGCAYAVRYNTINDAEACCEACRSLEWIDATGGDADPSNPCLAWQIVDGKCRILRKSWFETKYGAAGLGRYSGIGNEVMTVSEVITTCAPGNPACERADDSHGNWGSCWSHLRPGDAGYAVTEDCAYFSFMYYRNSTDVDTAAAVTTTYRKISVVNVTAEDEAVGLNISASVVLLVNRSRLYELETDSFDANAPYGATPADTCAQIAVYDGAALDSTLSTANLTVFDEETTLAPLCSSTCSVESGAILNVFCEASVLQAASRRQRRRLSVGSQPQLVLSYASVGGGYDNADFYPSVVAASPAAPSPLISPPAVPPSPSPKFPPAVPNNAPKHPPPPPLSPPSPLSPPLPSSPPPAAPPPVVTFVLVTQGDVDDYDNVTTAAITRSVATTLDLEDEDISVTIGSGSVIITVTIFVPPTRTVASVTTEVQTQLQSIATATAFISNQSPTSIAVEIVHTIPTISSPSSPPGSTDSTAISTGLSFGAIIGIAAPGVVFLFLAVAAIVIIAKGGKGGKKGRVADAPGTSTKSVTTREAAVV